MNEYYKKIKNLKGLFFGIGLFMFSLISLINITVENKEEPVKLKSKTCKIKTKNYNYE